MAKSARLQKFLEQARERSIDNLDQNLSRLPSFGAEMGAMFREAVKDVRATVHETAFGKGEHAPEVGAPMNPTQAQETAALTGREIYGRSKLKEGPELEM